MVAGEELANTAKKAVAWIEVALNGPSSSSFGGSSFGNMTKAPDVMIAAFCVGLFLLGSCICVALSPEDSFDGASRPHTPEGGSGLQGKAFRFTRPASCVENFHIPAVCPHLLGAFESKLPLLVPVDQVLHAKPWQVMILSGDERDEKRPLLEASLKEDTSDSLESFRDAVGLGRHRRVVELRELNGQRRLIASIDSFLQIKGRRQDDAGDSLSPFARLLTNESGTKFLLYMGEGRPLQWMLIRKPDGSFVLLWFADGVNFVDVSMENGFIATSMQEAGEHEHLEVRRDWLGRKSIHPVADSKESPGKKASKPLPLMGSSSSRQLHYNAGSPSGLQGARAKMLATVSRGKDAQAGCLEVLTVPGVDIVLVIAAVLGVLSFPSKEPPQARPAVAPEGAG